MKKQLAMPTYLKYFLSYLLICTVFALGTYFIIRNQLTRGYFEQRLDSARIQLNNVAQHLNDNLIFLSQIDTSLSCNDTILKNRYLKDDFDSYEIMRELKQYETSSRMISSIVYMSREPNIPYPISTQYMVTWDEDGFHIIGSSEKIILFDPSPYLDCHYGQLIFLSDEEIQYLIYFPSISSMDRQIFFYIIDTSEIQSQMKSLVSEEMLAVALVDKEGQMVKGINLSRLMPYLDSMEQETGTYWQDSEMSICVSQEINNGYHLVSLLSNDFLMSQITVVFAGSYLALVLLSIVSFLLIFVAMRVTYMPLRRLARKIAPDAPYGSSHLNQLESTFSEVTHNNKLLKEKLDNYRSSIQKSLLDSLVMSETAGEAVLVSNIDQFFDISIDKKIYIICINCATGEFSEEKFLNHLRKTIHEQDACLTLECNEERAVFLINYRGSGTDKDERLKQLLYDFYKQFGCMSAISKSSDSPMDIPALYENAMDASRIWSENPVADGASQSVDAELYAYPRSKLEELSTMLSVNQFSKAWDLTDELLKMVDNIGFAESNLHNFYVHSILIDMLMNIVNAMNQSNIEFSTYSNLYYETLYFCRSHSYAAKADVIATNIRELLKLYEKKNMEKLVNSAPFRQAIDEGYCQPEFSIAVLADKFHVSVSYMSYQLKKELNMTFSEYLWMQRMNKAKELLSTTDMSVDEISIAVGYYSSSGFMRKFKQETGLTPSQFRMKR